MHLRDRILGGLWGAVIGDALGVPAEFQGRAARDADPVRGMRGGGAHGQPPGTWSDDSSLLLCTAEALARRTDLEHLFDRFTTAVSTDGGAGAIGVDTGNA